MNQYFCLGGAAMILTANFSRTLYLHFWTGALYSA